MIKYENDCCGCANGAYPCRGNSCELRHAKHLYCDECRDDVETLYIVNGYELCGNCALDEFEKISLED